MKTKTTHFNLGLTLLVLFAAVGCSKPSSDSADSDSDSEVSPKPSKALAAADDKRAEEILKSPDIVEARDWVRRFPKSLFSNDTVKEDAEGGTPLGPVVERLFAAGAQRVVVQHINNTFYAGLVVVLPTEAPAREKIFAMDPELSQLCQQRQSKDFGQKYLYYTPD